MNDTVYRAEYQEKRRIHERLGVSEERYIKHRRREDLANADQPSPAPTAAPGSVMAAMSDDQLRAEYLSHERIHEALGVTPERYIAKRREEGVPVPTATSTRSPVARRIQEIGDRYDAGMVGFLEQIGRLGSQITEARL